MGLSHVFVGWFPFGFLSEPNKQGSLLNLDCYWVGSFDFSFLESQGVFH